MTLKPSARSDIKWWVDNVEYLSKKISQPQPDIVLTTDASKEGWEQ